MDKDGKVWPIDKPGLGLEVDEEFLKKSENFAPREPVDVKSLARALAQPACGLVRAKGVLRDRDGSLKVLHLVGERFEVTPFGGPNGVAAGLACIGLRGRLGHAAIEAAIAAAATDK